MPAPPTPRAPATGRHRTLAGFGLGSIALISLQALIEPTGVNIYCAVICAIAATATVTYCLRLDVIGRFPVSVMALLGFCITTYTLPLVAQSLSGKPLVYNLLVPRETFEATVLFQGVLLAAHMTYANLRPLHRASQWLAGRVLRPLWFFRVPTALELWALGGLGIGATWVSRILYVDAVEFGNVGGKFLQALVPFIVTPFFIPFRGPFVEGRVASARGTTPLLVAYFALVIMTAVFFNARAIFAVVLFTILITSFLMLATRRVQLSGRAKLWIAVASLAIIPVNSVAQNLATAMKIARGLRGSATPAEIAQATFELMGDKATLERYRATEFLDTAESGFAGYSEVYLDSEFLQRLTYTKYTDLTMAASVRLADFQRRAIKRDAYESIVSILPTPIINFLGLDVQKANRGFSNGDVYANLAFNQELGGFRSGSSITNSIDVLDYFWPVGIFLIAVLMYLLLDSYTLVSNGRLMISGVAFILFYQIFARGLVYDSFRELVDGVTRAYVQALFVYAVLSFCARMAVLPLQAAIPQRRGGARYLAAAGRRTSPRAAA